MVDRIKSYHCKKHNMQWRGYNDAANCPFCKRESEQNKNQSPKDRASRAKSTRKINRVCCRNCLHYEDFYMIPDYYTGEDHFAWGCAIINYDEDAGMDEDELFIIDDDMGLAYLMVCEEFEPSKSKDQS